MEMENKEELLRILEKQMDQWQTELAQFRVIAEVADKDAQIKHYQIISELADLKEAFEQKIDELRSDSVTHWEAFLEEIEAERDRLNGAIEAAHKKIN